MLISRSQCTTEEKPQLRGGEGISHFVHLVDPDKVNHGRLLAEITLLPGASIGYHQHDKETEYFIILSGTGMLNDNGTEKPIKAGDTIVTPNGESHSVKNTGTVPLAMHAIIIYD
jgi:mannose-6-phosphate isomerase-like protein (cupin superfamily)